LALERRQLFILFYDLTALYKYIIVIIIIIIIIIEQ